ncbi:toxin-antitoxin system HicB family antitoxin, partial [Salmonella enterica]|nr:toxin-antitoxin system HicB family antitoxin [Salmonella enterica]ECX3697014.1 toxin-antitoxin system HicB family antitoxin [Salmonella enterica subsp. enterica serovar Worthington]
MSISRDKQPKGGGKSPMLPIRIPAELRKQFDELAQAENTSTSNWLKELGRAELRR